MKDILEEYGLLVLGAVASIMLMGVLVWLFVGKTSVFTGYVSEFINFYF